MRTIIGDWNNGAIRREEVRDSLRRVASQKAPGIDDSII